MSSFGAVCTSAFGADGGGPLSVLCGAEGCGTDGGTAGAGAGMGSGFGCATAGSANSAAKQNATAGLLPATESARQERERLNMTLPTPVSASSLRP